MVKPDESGSMGQDEHMVFNNTARMNTWYFKIVIQPEWEYTVYLFNTHLYDCKDTSDVGNHVEMTDDFILQHFVATL